MSASTDDDAPKTDGKASAAKTKRTSEEHRQLLTLHMSKMRAKLAEVNELREPLKAAQDDFTALVNEAKADLGKNYTRKYLMTLLEDASARLRNLIEEEERRARDREALGLPVFGVQADLFSNPQTDRMPAEARDEIQWEAEGYLRGRNGLLQEIPDGTPPRFYQAVMRGYERGQKATQDDYLAGEELKKQLAEPAAEQKPVDLNAGAETTPEQSVDEEKAAERKAIRRARESLSAMGAPANEVAA